MKHKFFQFLFLVWVFGSCNVEKKEGTVIIPIDPNESLAVVALSEFADDIEILKLNPPADHPFGWIRQVLIKKEHIYVVDVLSHIVFVYDRQGGFISMLNSTGRGPGEYNRIGPVFIDDNETYLETLTYAGEGFGLLRYSIPNFKYLGFKPLLPLMIDSGVKAEGIYYLGNHQSFNSINQKNSNAGLIIIGEDDKLHTYFDYDRQIDDLFFSVHRDNFVVNPEGEVFFMMMYDPTIYQLKGCSIDPIMRIEFGNQGIDNTIRYLAGREQIKYLRNAHKMVSFPFLKAFNKDMFVLSYFFKENASQLNEPVFTNDDQRHYIRLGNTQKVFHANKIRNDLTSFPPFIFHGSEYRGISYNVMHEDYLVDILLPDNDLRRRHESMGNEPAVVCYDEYGDGSILLVFLKLIP